MKTKIMAVAIGVLFGLLGPGVKAHDQNGNPYPPPQNCEERCREVQCKCHDVCVKSGHDTCCASGTCKGDCNDQKNDCINRCQEQPTMRSAQ